MNNETSHLNLAPEVQDKCSVKAEVDVLTYSQREWKGNTAKCSLIRKVSQTALAADPHVTGVTVYVGGAGSRA